MKNTKEIRFFAENVEVKNDKENPNEMLVEGYAVVFDSPATHGFTEIIKKGALDNCNMKDVPLKYNHNDSFLILARTRNGSLSLEVDDKGLKVRAKLIDTTSNIDIYKSLKAGLLDKMSFAFTVSDEEWDASTDTRTITGIDCLYDVSIVDTPFYDTTEIYARALNTLDNEKKKLDNLRAERKLKKRKLLLKLRVMNLKGGM
jgi:HK97 family phage prohead protease|nr:MAG TPA_asm: prohead serine protease [Caudoviricetes sp.]